MSDKTKKITTLAMLCAMAFAAVALVRIPVVAFLKYEPKDVIIAIGGMLFGPLASVAVSATVSLVEMVTISDTGFYGLIMNIISSVSFAAVASLIYSRRRTVGGAVAGLLAGVAVMTPVMLLWNYIVTPLYMGYPREAVAAMLIPVFLPFNLLKGGLNAAIVMLLYKPLATALRKAHLVPEREGSSGGGFKLGITVVSAIVLVGLIVCLVLLRAKQ